MSKPLRTSRLLAATNIVVLVACTQAGSNEANVSRIPATPASRAGDPIDVAAIVGAEDRAPEDVETDVRRKPAELLTFMRLEPGMKVADIGAGFGYTTELLARAVGPTGTVYSQNTTFVLDRFARDGWNARLAKPINANAVGLERSFDDPFPDDIEPLDRVVNVLFYHDFEWMGVDRAAHVADVFAALRPGGTYVIVDSSALANHGAADSKSLHRIEESLVIAELEAGGFMLGARGEFLRNPGDTRDWNVLERAEAGEFSDKFVLEFVKP